MHSFLRTLSTLTIFLMVVLTVPLQAQQQTSEKPEKLFIQKGQFLTSFSLSFINASRDDFNQEFEREFTDISLQLDGLYFLSNHVGIGPLLGYRFTYRDLEDPFRGPHESDRDIRTSHFKFGAEGGWFIPVANMFGGSADAHFFIDGGVNFLLTQFKQEGSPEWDAHYRLGYQVGTGLLFPVGKHIALESKLGFQSHSREFRIRKSNPDGEDTIRTITKWPKEIALSVGLKVKL